jgi:hypothetical protein
VFTDRRNSSYKQEATSVEIEAMEAPKLWWLAGKYGEKDEEGEE